MELIDSRESSGINAFAWDFFDAAGEENMVFSPFGIYSALAMLANGAEPGSAAEEELRRVLRFDSKRSLNKLVRSIADGSFGGAEFKSRSLLLLDSGHV